MANLTITVDDETLKRARIRALEQGTSVNAVVRDYLEAFAGSRGIREEAIGKLLERSAKSRSRSGGRRWTRDELHER